MNKRMTDAQCLPEDHADAELVGRVWLPCADGPAVVRVHAGAVYDLSSVAATSSQLLNMDDPVGSISRAGSLPRIASLSELLSNSIPHARDEETPWFLAPCDLQAI